MRASPGAMAGNAASSALKEMARTANTGKAAAGGRSGTADGGETACDRHLPGW